MPPLSAANKDSRKLKVYKVHKVHKVHKVKSRKMKIERFEDIIAWQNSRMFIKFIKLKVVEKAENIYELDSAYENLSLCDQTNNFTNFTNFMNFKLKKAVGFSPEIIYLIYLVFRLYLLLSYSVI